MENKDSINCSNCNLPIFPPKLPEGVNVKDRFDQIRCLGCNTINSYTESQEVMRFYNPSSHSFRLHPILGWLIVISIALMIIIETLAKISLNPYFVYGLLITGLFIFLYKFKDLFK